MYSNEDFFRIFGNISIFFATLDFITTLTILRLAKKGTVATITDITTLQQKFRVLEGLRDDQAVDPAILAEVKSLLPAALKAGEKRNRFTHDQWLFDPSAIRDGKITHFEVKGLKEWKIVAHEHQTSWEELAAFLCEIGQLQIKFGKINDRLKSRTPDTAEE
jgi:hypothetical protein